MSKTVLIEPAVPTRPPSPLSRAAATATTDPNPWRNQARQATTSFKTRDVIFIALLDIGIVAG